MNNTVEKLLPKLKVATVYR